MVWLEATCYVGGIASSMCGTESCWCVLGMDIWVESSLLCCTKYDVYPSLECVNGEWLFHPTWIFLSYLSLNHVFRFFDEVF